jgi:hypothetical protein
MSGSTADSLLIHLHIPKNAGTTLGRVFRMRLARRPGNWLHLGQTLGLPHVRGAWTNRADALQALPERAQRRVRLFDAHGGWGMHERLPRSEDARYFTFLRDPVDRTLSAYYYLRSRGRFDREMSIAEFASGPPVRQLLWTVDNAHVRYLAANAGEIIDVEPGGVTRTMFDVAAERLQSDHMLVAGLTERFDASALLLTEVLGWSPPRYVRSNVTSDRRSREEIEPETIAMLEERNALDLELYELARAHLDRLIEARPGFQDRLVAFQASNMRYAKRMGPAYALVPRVSKAVRKLGLLR